MIDERRFLAAVVNLHSVQGCPPRCISVPKVLRAAESLSDLAVERTISVMTTSRRRATMKRCTKIHKQLWEVYQDALA